jgi:hypothetical protein
MSREGKKSTDPMMTLFHWRWERIGADQEVPYFHGLRSLLVDSRVLKNATLGSVSWWVITETVWRLVAGRLLNNELRRIGKETVLIYRRYYPGIRFEGLRKRTETSVKIVGPLAEIRTEHLRNAIQRLLPLH